LFSGTLLQPFQRKMLKKRAADYFEVLVHCYHCFKEKCWRCRQQILPKFWCIATIVSKKSAEDASSRSFRSSGALLPLFQRKMLKMQAAVHCYHCFKGKYWRCRQQCIATIVSKKNAEDAGSRFFQNSGNLVTHCVTSSP
jgi:hypothetical protein